MGMRFSHLIHRYKLYQILWGKLISKIIRFIWNSIDTASGDKMKTSIASTVIAVLMIMNMLVISVMAQESTNSNILLEKYPLDKCHINVSKILAEPDKIIYEIIVENYTAPKAPGQLDYGTGLHSQDVSYYPSDISLYYSVNDNVYICYNGIKTEYKAIVRNAQTPYTIYEPDPNGICKGTVIKGASDQLLGMLMGFVPGGGVIGGLYSLSQYSTEVAKCLPTYPWWCKCIIQYESSNQIIEHSNNAPDIDILTSIAGKTEDERNSRRSDTIRFSAIASAFTGYSIDDQINAVKFTIPLKLKDPSGLGDLRLWIDSIDQNNIKVGSYIEDADIGKFKPSAKPTKKGQITNIIWPSKDIYDHLEPIPVKVDFTNIGSEEHSFWIGYSVQDSSGKWWDAPARQATVTQPGESGSLELEWKPPEDAPQGAYTAKVALWEGSNFDTGLMEGEFDSRKKDDAFRLNTAQASNDPQLEDIKPSEATYEAKVYGSYAEWLEDNPGTSYSAYENYLHDRLYNQLFNR
jgi:hypothetical protein